MSAIFRCFKHIMYHIFWVGFDRLFQLITPHECNNGDNAFLIQLLELFAFVSIPYIHDADIAAFNQKQLFANIFVG